MVSKARLDFPEPDRPVTTTRRSRGISSEMFFRLWTRAPCTPTVVRAVFAAGLSRRFAELAVIRLRLARTVLAPAGAVRWVGHIEERQLLHVHVASLREADRCRGL